MRPLDSSGPSQKPERSDGHPADRRRGPKEFRKREARGAAPQRWLGCVVLFLLAGCEPKERAEWSPDGNRAAVLAEQRLHFADSQGELSPPLADRDESPGRFLVDAFDWLPDSSGLVVHRVRIVPKWEAFAPLLSESDSARVEALAARVPALLQAAVALHGDSDRAEQLLGKLAPGESLVLGNALRLALARDAASVRSALDGAPKALASLASGDGEMRAFVLHEIAVLRPDSGGPAEILSRGLRGIASLKVSPRHPVVACAAESGEAGRHDLVALPLDPGPAVTVAAGTTRAFDWTPEGRSLVFLSSISQGNGGLLEIERRLVLDDRGRLGDSPPGGEDDGGLAYAVVAFSPRLAVLPDGDILFASHPATLPAAPGEIGENPRLYRLPAAGGPPVAIPAAEGALPMDLGYFVPSPDGRRLLVVESGTDAVALVDLESGKSELVAGPNPGWKTRAMPSWRNAEEFTFAAAGPGSKRVRWMLWRDGKTTDLGANWPDTITKAWMEFK